MPQPAPIGAPVPVPQQKLPGLVGIWLGIAVIVIGVIAAIVLMVVGLRAVFSGFDDMERVSVGATGFIQIDDRGSQSIYAERPSSGEDVSFGSSTGGAVKPRIEVQITGPDGELIPVRPTSMNETYTWNGRSGVLIGRFDAPVAGRYQVSSQGGDGSFSYSTLAVGEIFNASGIIGILGSIAVGGMATLIGIIVIVISAVRRSKARKQQQPPWGHPGVPPYGYGPAGGAGALPGWETTPGWAPPPAPPYPPSQGPTS